MWGTKNSEMNKITQEIWDYLISKGIIITAEYLPTAMNRKTNWESLHFQNRIGRKLRPQVLKDICSIFSQTSLDIIASRLTTQMATYIC